MVRAEACTGTMRGQCEAVGYKETSLFTSKAKRQGKAKRRSGTLRFEKGETAWLFSLEQKWPHAV